jgi:hypothetical protein
MELTLDQIFSFLEKNELSTPSIELPFSPYLQTFQYEPKKRPIVPTKSHEERENKPLTKVRDNREYPKTVSSNPVSTNPVLSNPVSTTSEPIKTTPEPLVKPVELSRGKTLWEALVPFVDPTAPLFTETMKQEASALIFQTIRDTLMEPWANRCGKPSSVRACLKALDQPELKIGMDTVSWTVLATLFHYMWDCNLLLKEKQKEIIKGHNCSTTLKIEHSKTEWLVSKI